MRTTRRWASLRSSALSSPERLSEARRINTLYRLLPAHIEQKALWDKERFSSVHELREWALTRIRATMHLGRDAPRVQLISELEPDDDDDIRREVLALSEDATEVEANVIRRRMQQRRGARTAPPRAAAPKGGRLVSSSPLEVKIWELASGTCLTTLQHGVHENNALVVFDDGRLASGTNNEIVLWSSALVDVLRR